MDEPVCLGCWGALKWIAELESRVAGQTAKVEGVLRAGKRQAAPKAPGRQFGEAHGPGHPPVPPGLVAEFQASPPEARPHCSGPPVGAGRAEEFRTETLRQSPVYKFFVHLGRCTACGAPARGQHPLMTPRAGGGSSQIGPHAHATAIHRRNHSAGRVEPDEERDRRRTDPRAGNGKQGGKER